jgi:hypothetical protein
MKALAGIGIAAPLFAAMLATLLSACAPCPARFESLPGRPIVAASLLVRKDSCHLDDGWITFTQGQHTKTFTLHFEWGPGGLSAAGFGAFDRLLFQAHWDSSGTRVQKVRFSGLPFNPARLAGDFILIKLDSAHSQNEAIVLHGGRGSRAWQTVVHVTQSTKLPPGACGIQTGSMRDSASAAK